MDTADSTPSLNKQQFGDFTSQSVENGHALTLNKGSDNLNDNNTHKMCLSKENEPNHLLPSSKFSKLTYKMPQSVKGNDTDCHQNGSEKYNNLKSLQTGPNSQFTDLKPRVRNSCDPSHIHNERPVFANKKQTTLNLIVESSDIKFDKVKEKQVTTDWNPENSSSTSYSHLDSHYDLSGTADNFNLAYKGENYDNKFTSVKNDKGQRSSPVCETRGNNVITSKLTYIPKRRDIITENKSTRNKLHASDGRDVESMDWCDDESFKTASSSGTMNGHALSRTKGLAKPFQSGQNVIDKTEKRGTGVNPVVTLSVEPELMDVMDALAPNTPSHPHPVRNSERAQDIPNNSWVSQHARTRTYRLPSPAGPSHQSSVSLSGSDTLQTITHPNGNEHEVKSWEEEDVILSSDPSLRTRRHYRDEEDDIIRALGGEVPMSMTDEEFARWLQNQIDAEECFRAQSSDCRNAGTRQATVPDFPNRHDGLLAHGRGSRVHSTARRGLQLRPRFNLPFRRVHNQDSSEDEYETNLRLQEAIGDAKSKAMPPEVIFRLPTHTYTKTEIECASRKECQICMSNFIAGETERVLPCFHTFHVMCIDPWFEMQATCPVCRESAIPQD